MQAPAFAMVMGGTTTNITVNYDDTGHHCEGVAVEMRARQAGKDAPVARFYKIEQRIECRVPTSSRSAAMTR